jgi:hypothetical protein
MPEFRMDPPKPFQKINVLFTRWEDVEAFGRAIRQPVTRKTKSVWYPPKPKRSRKEKMFHSINPNPPLPSTPGWKPREAPSDESAVASVPFMITRHMRNQLHRLGYSDDEIAELTPQEAHDIVRDAADFDDDEITSKLHRCGYSDDEIAMLTPQEAHDIVRDAADTADDDEITSND